MRILAVVIVVLALVNGTASAQTAGEQANIVRDFQRSVVDYTGRHQCLDMFPGALSATTPVPGIFTLPVAMVFRQMIAKTLTERDGVARVSGVGGHPHATALEPFPSNWLQDFPRVLRDALPPLPAPLEYRLIGHDLAIRDRDADIIVAVLRNAVGPALTAIR